MRFPSTILRALLFAALSCLPLAATVSVGGDPAGLFTEDFEAFLPGELHSTLEAPSLLFGEKFVGQSRTSIDDHDVVTGLPTSPLEIDPNVDAERSLITTRPGSTIILNGCGELRCPRSDAIGEGSVAVLYSVPQRVVSFRLIGGNQGIIRVRFYNSSGTLLGDIADDATAGVKTYTSTERDILGVLVENRDSAGVSYDDWRYRLDPVEETCDLSPIEAKLDMIEPKLDDQKAEITDIKAEITDIKAEVADLAGRLDALMEMQCQVLRLLHTPEGERLTDDAAVAEQCGTTYRWNSESTGGPRGNP